MAQTRFRIDEQMQLSSNPRSILITDGSNKPSYFAPTTGADTILFWDDSASNWAQLTLGTNLSITGTTINASAGAGGYAEVQEEGTPVTARTKLNFIGSGFTAADDAPNTRTNVTLATILNNIATTGSVDLTSHVSGDLPFTNIAQLAGLSVLGNSTNATADMAAITAASDHQVLRRSGTSIGFGAINLAQTNAVTGILDETNGGTGQSSYILGDTLYGSAANTLAKLAGNTTTTKQYLSQTGTGSVSAAPVWSQIAEADIANGTILARLGDNETISGTWTFNNNITVPTTPTNSTHATSKAYVDSLIQGAKGKASVRVATTTAGTLATSFENGDIVDGITLVTGDRILIKDQAAQAENGIYIVNVSGAPTRATDADAWTELVAAHVWVEVGTANADTGWLCTVDQGGTLGTTAVTWVQFSGLGSITAGAGLTKTGNTIDVGTASTARIVVNADNIDLATTAATPGSFGSATQSATFTVDAYGRLTASGQTTISIPSTAVSDFTEAVQDVVGAFATDSGRIDFTYNDAGNTLTADIVTNSVTFAYMQQVGTDVLIGRDAAGTGNLTTISLGTGLAFSGSDSIIHADTSSVGNIDTSGAQVIDTMTFDGMGHVTAFTTRNLALSELSGVSIAAPSTNEVLTYNGTNWVNATAQGGTTTRAFVEGSTASSIDLDANTGVVKDRDGNNVSFTIPTDTNKFFVYRNGVRQMETGGAPGNTTRDYSVNTSTHVLTLTYALTSDEVLMVEKLG